MPGKTSPSSGLQIQLPQASGKRREFDLKEGKFVCNLNYEVGVLLVATGVAFLTGGFQSASLWLMETFPQFGLVG